MRTYRDEMDKDYSDDNFADGNGYSDGDLFYDRPEFNDNRFQR